MFSSPFLPLPHLSPLLPVVCTLFCTNQNLNPFVFMQFHTLSQKHPGWGALLPTRAPRFAKYPLPFNEEKMKPQTANSVVPSVRCAHRTPGGRQCRLPASQCASHCLLLKNVPAFLPLSARRKNSQQGVPVSAQLEKETSSLEMDREVIRCKTCGLVQYRTRTGNCRRCVRALPQRLEFLIPPPAPPEEAAAEPTPEKFVNQQTVQNIGQPIRQLRESRSMTQSQLQPRSKAPPPYPPRI